MIRQIRLLLNRWPCWFRMHFFKHETSESGNIDPHHRRCIYCGLRQFKIAYEWQDSEVLFASVRPVATTGNIVKAAILVLISLAMLYLFACTPPPMQHNARWYTPAEQVTAFLATRDYFIEMGHAFDEATEQVHRLHSIRVHVNCEAEK